MTDNNNQFTIPPELQGFCDIYLNNLRGRLSGLGEKGKAALQRAISYFEGDSQALVREVTTQLELRPSYFGFPKEKASCSQQILLWRKLRESMVRLV